MVKTTITLEDALYKKLVEESLDRYGKTRNLSKLINEKLKFAQMQPPGRMPENVRESFGCWKTSETGSDYVTRLRKQSERRLTRLNV